MKKDYFFSEWAIYRNAEEKDKAKTYLELWKFFHSKKLPKTLSFVKEQWVEREFVLNMFDGHILALKLMFSGEINDLGDYPELNLPKEV